MRHLHMTAPAAIAALGLLLVTTAPGIAADDSDAKSGAFPVERAHAPGGGHGMMGRQMMGRGMMGQGMMGPGMMGRGMMGRGMMGMMGGEMRQGFGMRVVRSLNLSTADVNQYLERRLSAHPNKRLKLGDVKEKSKDTIVAAIVTKDGSVVYRFEVNRHTGLMRWIN